MEKILVNAIPSIHVGIEDFESVDPNKMLSAVRNIYAGVLLLCKTVLWRKSPKANQGLLIYASIVPKTTKSGDLVFVARGRKTVDRSQIQEIFHSLDMALDWQKLNRIAAIRNDIEHHYTTEPHASVKEALAEAFFLIYDLVVRKLDENPAELIEQRCWNGLLRNEQIFREEKERCMITLASLYISSPSATSALDGLLCTDCGSSLIYQSDPDNTDLWRTQLLCSSCGGSLDSEQALEEAIERQYEGESYIAMTDGGDQPLETCPECVRESYVREEDRCAICGFSLAGMTCAICHQRISPEEYNLTGGSLCAYHHHVMEKD